MKGIAALAIALAAGCISAADPPNVRTPLTPATERKSAAPFTLQDAAGKNAQLSDYKGRVLLLNFWATWCGGCKVEIPWFQQFETTFGPKQFATFGVSLDDKGWSAVKPWIEKAEVTYRMAIADTATPDRYAVTALPATFLIDRRGRIAATYIGLVDRANIESNIRTLLAER